MNKKIINLVFTLIIIKTFVSSAFNIWVVLFVLFICADWFLVQTLTDDLNYERKQDETLQREYGILHKHGFLDIGPIHRSDLDID